MFRVSNIANVPLEGEDRLNALLTEANQSGLDTFHNSQGVSMLFENARKIIVEELIPNNTNICCYDSMTSQGIVLSYAISFGKICFQIYDNVCEGIVKTSEITIKIALMRRRLRLHCQYLHLDSSNKLDSSDTAFNDKVLTLMCADAVNQVPPSTRVFCENCQTKVELNQTPDHFCQEIGLSFNAGSRQWEALRCAHLQTNGV